MDNENELPSKSSFIYDDDIILEENQENFVNYFINSPGVNWDFFTPNFFDNINDSIKNMIVFENNEYTITITFKKYMLLNINGFVPKINIYSKSLFLKYVSIHPTMFYNPYLNKHNIYRSEINAIIFSIMKKLLLFDDAIDSIDIYLFDNLWNQMKIEVVENIFIPLIHFPLKIRTHMTVYKFFSKSEKTFIL